MEGIGDAPDGMGFDMKMMVNQQPNPYGGTFAQDASPVYSGLPGPSFQDDPAMGMGEDQNDAKRRRIARVSPRSCFVGVVCMVHGADRWAVWLCAQACDMCRKKKIKCDGRMPKCSHCINYKTDCVFTPVEKKRNPPKGYVCSAPLCVVWRWR